jgi:citrate lyase subunit beta/citryl-CoA lyase
VAGRVPGRIVLVPKCETVETLNIVRSAVGREVKLIPQIEIALGLQNAADLLSHKRHVRAAFGHLDFALDIDAETVREALAFARG